MRLKDLSLFAPGQKFGEFELTKATEVTELQCVLREFRHLPTGAEVVHIAANDPENLFCLSFQTLPSNSNGVAHILEHTVLCGSKKFPVKDPFFAMSRRSLNTFLNALTGSDFTCYPAASQVKNDFYNLLEVYLDAVFHPNLNRFSFLQEGHRLEFAIPSDPRSPLEYKGIVFNEMKGALASASARLHEATMTALFPDITYGVNSGGTPEEIPNLSYEELIAFHSRFYHPSRCLFFFYGDLPVEEHLSKLEKLCLKDVEKAPPLPKIPCQPRFTSPKRLKVPYPIVDTHDMSRKTLYSFSWLTCNIQEQEELLALSLLDSLLLENDAALLQKELLRSKLCVQVNSYFEEEMHEAPFTIQLKGCEEGQGNEIEALIFKTLKEISKHGISYERVENVIHQFELEKSEIGEDHHPFGLTLFMRSGLLKQHGIDPVDGLKVHSLYNNIRQSCKEDPYFFSKLIDKYLLSNPHFVRLELTPDETLAAKELAIEKKKLTKLKKALNKEEESALLKQAAELAAFQMSQEEESSDLLPKVSLDDVPKKSRVFKLEKESVGNLEVFYHNTFTNGIIYIDLVYDLPHLQEEELSYVKLFSTLIGQVGSGGKHYHEHLDYLQANTGGLSAVLSLNLNAENEQSFSPTLQISSKALERKAKPLFEILKESVESLDFKDTARLKELILKQYTAMQSSLNSNAMRYAINLSAKGVDIPSKIASYWHGLDYFFKIKELATSFDSFSSAIVERLEDLKSRLLGIENPHLVITCDEKSYLDLKANHFYGLGEIRQKKGDPWVNNFPLDPVQSQARLISSPIAFIAKVIKTIPFASPDSAPLAVAAYLCDNLVLHTKIREQGGAYGGGAVSNTMSGNFYFYSYRDPNIASTLDAFNEAVKVVAKGDFDQEELEEAKLEMIQSLDSPISPGSRGEYAYGWLREGKTLHLRQGFRNRLLSLSVQDVANAVSKYIIPAYAEGAEVVFAGKDLIEKENKRLEELGLKPFQSYTI